MPSGLISTSSGSVSASKISATSLGNGAALRPWNDRVQSTFSSGCTSSSSGLSDSPVFWILSVVGWEGVGAATLLAREFDAEVEGAEVVDAGAGLVGFAGAEGDDRDSCRNGVE